MSEQLEKLSVLELRQKAKELGVKLGAGMNKQGIVEKLRAAMETEAPAPARPVRSAVLITDDEPDEEEDDIPVLTPNPAFAAPRPAPAAPAPAQAPAVSSLASISAKAPAFTMEGSRAWHNPRAYQAPAAPRHTAPTQGWGARPAAPERAYARPAQGYQEARAAAPQPSYPVRFGPAESAPEAAPRQPEARAPYAPFQDYQPRQEPAYHAREQAAPAGPSIAEILAAGECGDGEGILELHPDGYGFLRARQYRAGKSDIYISNAQIRRFSLRSGDYVAGKTKAQKDSDRYSAMLYITEINGRPAEEVAQRPRFEEMTPVYPTKRLTLHASRAADGLLRQIDLMAPVGMGQRALLLTPENGDRLALIRQLAFAVDRSHSKPHLMLLLVDQRPEDVTWLSEDTPGEIIATTFDQPLDTQARVSELAMERAMRLAEQGQDVVVLADSLNRLCRSFVPAVSRLSPMPPDEPASPTAVTRVKRFLGAARNLKEGGSVTVIITAEASESRPDQALLNEVRRYVNCVLDVESGLTALKSTSYTLHSDLILSPKDQEEAAQLRD